MGASSFYVLSRLLRLRREHPGLFSRGEYVSLSVTGAQGPHVFAFLRRHEGMAAVVVVPRLVRTLLEGEVSLPLGSAVWGDTQVALPEQEATMVWQDVFTGAQGQGPALRLGEVLAHAPVAVLLTSPIAG